MKELFQWLSTNSIATLTVLGAFSFCILAIGIVYIGAFIQGRELSFWPPKVGKKPEKSSTKVENETLQLLEKRLAETEKIAEQYKKWWQELSEDYEQHKNELLKRKNELIIELEKANSEKDDKLKHLIEEKLRELTVKENLITQLSTRLFTDPVTNLHNIQWLREQFFAQILADITFQNTKFALLLFDLDNFKKINDEKGTNFGDKILAEIARKMASFHDKTDAIIHRKGDEFIIIHKYASIQEVEILLNNIQQLILTPLMIDGTSIRMTASAGISLYPQDGDTVEMLLQKAERAVRECKNNEKNYIFYQNIA